MVTSNYQAQARGIVRNYIELTRDKTIPKPRFEIFVVWFSKTLQNWKALIGTTLGDGRYYEVTHNGELHESYLDVYKKHDNVVIGPKGDYI